MFTPTTPLEVAAVIAAVGWPLLAGLAVVGWSRARAARRARRESDLQAGLAELYRDVAARPTPDRLTLVVDALEEAEAMAQPPAGAPAAKARHPAISPGA